MSTPHSHSRGRVQSEASVTAVGDALVARRAAYAAAGELLKALSAPVRVAIVMLLSAGPRCVHELVDELGVAQPLVSQHLRVLRAAGLVAGQRQGREVAYHLTDDHVGHIVADAVAHAQESPPGGGNRHAR